jgi:hypothetical protein
MITRGRCAGDPHPDVGHLPEEHHDSWLYGEAVKQILVPFPADRMMAWSISSRVNGPKNNDAEIVVPIEPHTGQSSILDPRV